MMNCQLLLTLMLGASLITACAKDPLQGAGTNTRFTLWQLPNQTHSQMLSYVLRTPGGKLVVIDGGVSGDAGYLKGFLAALGNDVEAWFITHAHDDHLGALTAMLGKPDAPRIHTLYGSLPTLDWVRRYGAGKGDVEPYDAFLKELAKANLPVTELKLGDDFKIDRVRFEVLGVHNPEITNNAINNSSLVLRVSDRSKSILFTADLGVEGGCKLLASKFAKRLHADYVQMAHHGQQGVNEEFYRTVRPAYCLWTTPRWLWENDSGGGRGSGPWKTLIVRGWMEQLNIKQHFLMADGLCVIR
jgi:beta-lactamase superfamily II metal-dependent hydrolase